MEIKDEFGKVLLEFDDSILTIILKEALPFDVVNGTDCCRIELASMIDFKPFKSVVLPMSIERLNELV